MGQTYIIAEAGVNHNGSIELAKKLVDVAVKAGADAVKFQTFKAENLVNREAPKADYQRIVTNKEETQFEMLKRLELDHQAHEILVNYCQRKGIEFLSTPFDIESVDLLVNDFDLSIIKVPSGEITNGPLLLKIAKTKKSVILSTGMSTLGEVEQALAVLAFGYCDKANPSLENFKLAFSSNEGQEALKKYVTLLHCTTEYPAPYSEVNLKVMDTLKQAFNLPVGYSDHTNGISIPLAAVARGAKIIEKHFTLDRNLPGPDHQASLEPDELIAMVKGIREVEEAIGYPQKYPGKSEVKNIHIARKSIVANRRIEKGDVFTEENLSIKRPGGGKSPIEFWGLLGKPALRNFEQDEVIE